MKIFFQIFIFLIPQIVFSQHTDILENTFKVENNVLIKEENNNKVYQYQNNQFGEISSVDVSNPFQILVFFKIFNQCVVLDEKLSPISTIKFKHFNIYASVICSSSNNGIWIYDDIVRRLIYFDKETNEITFHKYFQINDQALFIFEQDNYIFLGTSANLFVFNRFCVKLKKYDFKYNTHLIIQNRIIIKNNDGASYEIVEGVLHKINVN